MTTGVGKRWEGWESNLQGVVLFFTYKEFYKFNKIQARPTFLDLVDLITFPLMFLNLLLTLICLFMVRLG